MQLNELLANPQAQPHAALAIHIAIVAQQFDFIDGRLDLI